MGELTMTVTTSTGMSMKDVKISELLVPVDLSHESWSVLPLASSIAQRLGILLVPLFVDVSTLGSHAVLEGPVLLRASVDGAAVSVEVVPGTDVVEAIDAHLSRRPGSVVVMSTHGLGGFAERAWGNVCDELLRARTDSVLVVGPRFNAHRNAEVHRVAVCIDAAAPDGAIVRDAIGWAEALDVPMVVLAVEGRGRSRPGEDETYKVLAAIFEDLPPTRVPVTAEAIDDPDVAAAIVGYADRRPGTLLAIAPGAARRAVHVLTHTVAMRVASDTQAPMLLRWHQAGSQPPAIERVASAVPAQHTATSCHDDYDEPLIVTAGVHVVAGTGCHDDYDAL
jgi:nucleotide-binding universal stress UspA family protein